MNRELNILQDMINWTKKSPVDKLYNDLVDRSSLMRHPFQHVPGMQDYTREFHSLINVLYFWPVFVDLGEGTQQIHINLFDLLLRWITEIENQNYLSPYYYKTTDFFPVFRVILLPIQIMIVQMLTFIPNKVNRKKLI